VKNWTLKSLAPLGVLACLSLSGCLVADDDDDDYDPAPVGSLTVTWSIDGIQDPDDCIDLGVDRLELRIYTLGGDLVDEVEPYCEDFAVTVDMVDGFYDAEATLVDSFDTAATLTEPIDDVDIQAGTDLQVDIDFPIDSFL
jgi:hypothetical protein